MFRLAHPRIARRPFHNNHELPAIVLNIALGGNCRKGTRRRSGSRLPFDARMIIITVRTYDIRHGKPARNSPKRLLARRAHRAHGCLARGPRMSPGLRTEAA